MKKMPAFLAIVVFLAITSAGYSSTVVIPDPVVSGMAATVEVHIELVDINGNPVSGSVQVSDFYAVDQETGARYYAGQNDVFFIPAGTYSFEAGRTGPWEGVVPGIATIEEGESLVVVQLTHWYE